MKPEGARPWHSLPPEEALSAFQSCSSGLDEQNIETRREQYGPNSLPEPPKVNPLKRFLAQFNNALIYFLLVSALAALLLDHVVDAAVILLVVVVNAVVGFVQEGRAEKALSGMRNLISPHAFVLRNGHRHSIAVEEVVPGDLVLLDPGDRVPADLRLLRARGLAIEEAMLTGESVAAEKAVAPVSPDAPLAERACMAFSGTLVTKGQATGLVVATGSETEIGKISGMLGSVTHLVTPLLRQIDRFAHWLTFVILGCGAALFAFAVMVRDFAWDDALIAVVAVSVGAIPEGLPAVITITLAIGVQRMAGRKAVIRKLPAVETLGATSVICTDKTGTLTRNEMTVRHIMTGERELLAEGTGYDPAGTLSATDGGDDMSAQEAAQTIIRCGILCNDAHLKEVDGNWAVAGDPMEGALISLGRKAGFDVEALRQEWLRIDEVPFDAAYRFMATLHRAPDGTHVIFLKGAPEALLSRACDADRERDWNDFVHRSASEGERLLGFAMLELPGAQERISFEDLEGLHMLGLMGFVDPPREEARRAIAECRSAGIAVKMITGDHVATAKAIARQLDLADDPQAMTGAELEQLSDAELEQVVPSISVFARASPEHKLRIVQALQTRGEIVAMTGDGVNDAPSLKQADVGTAMGVGGTEVAREAAEMVLLDDNFASIVAAVNEGRTVYDNIRKVIAWTLPTNGGEGITIVLAILAGFTLPMTATQILWINLVTAISLGLALAFEPPEPGVMARPPRRRDTPLLSPFLVWRVLLVSALFAGVALAIYFGALAMGDDLATARTMVVNMLVVAEIFYLFNVRYLHVASLSLRGIVGTPAVLLALAFVIAMQLAFTYLPFMQAVFDTRPLNWIQGSLIIGAGIVLFAFLEAEKLLMRHLGHIEDVALPDSDKISSTY
ncbi:cation-transporting P-type ATPase [Altericroceibacterium spongiae]|uniref:Cation-transporting P-type ATPase n=1 Tax=Altericroceibacterium spongiae TaxID=2320269 RepID=A0A420EQS0_9SPHN|nr:cation-transporting P-type ATPase [Altericroceibacterium spongiae]RKF23027.1 cation-transporting P-type ATPase [Altericroceibacterium spongiae]